MATDGDAVVERLTLNAIAEETRQVEAHEAHIREWFEEAKAELAHADISHDEIWFDVVSSYIGAELRGGEKNAMAAKIRARLAAR